MPSTDLETLEHELFSNSPIAMLRLDADGRVVWANHALSELIGLPSTQLLGHTRKSLPSPAHRELFNTSRLLHLEGPGAPERWLRCDVQALEHGGGAAIHYFQDVTHEMQLERDNASLHLQLDNLRQTDEHTGLPNPRALLTQLELHVSRSRRYKNPLSLLSVEFRIVADDAIADGVTAPALRAVAEFLRGRLRWVDQIARWSDTGFMVVLPETSSDDAATLADNLVTSGDEIPLPEVFRGHRVTLDVAHASWRPGDDAASLLQRAQHGSATPLQPA